MTVRKDTIFEQFLAPIVKNFLVDRDALLRYSKSINWEEEGDRLRNPQLMYPTYYNQQNFHGIENGYLNVTAAVTYDAITQYVLPPNEEWVRKGLIERIRCQPRRILDLGCGTGSTTVLLKQAFPDAEVIGLDLSPYMLVAAQDKAQKAGLAIALRHANAEHIGFPDASFDLVTAALLFHETPPDVSVNILSEAFRLLTSGGEMAILDGNQATLRQFGWLTDIFEEPYIKPYADQSLDAWMGAAGFGNVRSDHLWWLHQVTTGIKPIPGQRVRFSNLETPSDGQWVMG
jgi:ubiquinone/menaquinone biosynthesis C-methylase UbiE